ncbi:hypothetical protein AGMMS49992_09880 [Clostridia bacterium]|nr:hypothetical protein AGMMS49992_09880 [Clostridia bacterium]
MATLHLMVGLPCSGKTTRAKEIERECNALRLTGDHWHLRLFGDDALDSRHNEHHEVIEAIMWEIASRSLALGINVIVDFGLWSKEERDDYKQRAKNLGVDCIIHYMNAPEAELFRRLGERNESVARGETLAFTIPFELMKKYCGHFQHCTAEELEGFTQ